MNSIGFAIKAPGVKTLVKTIEKSGQRRSLRSGLDKMRSMETPSPALLREQFLRRKAIPPAERDTITFEKFRQMAEKDARQAKLAKQKPVNPANFWIGLVHLAHNLLR